MCDLTCTWTKRLVTWLVFGPNDLWLDLTSDQMTCDLTWTSKEMTCDLTWTCKEMTCDLTWTCKKWLAAISGVLTTVWLCWLTNCWQIVRNITWGFEGLCKWICWYVRPQCITKNISLTNLNFVTFSDIGGRFGRLNFISFWIQWIFITISSKQPKNNFCVKLTTIKFMFEFVFCVMVYYEDKQILKIVGSNYFRLSDIVCLSIISFLKTCKILSLTSSLFYRTRCFWHIVWSCSRQTECCQEGELILTPCDGL